MRSVYLFDLMAQMEHNVHYTGLSCLQAPDHREWLFAQTCWPAAGTLHSMHKSNALNKYQNSITASVSSMAGLLVAWVRQNAQM